MDTTINDFYTHWDKNKPDAFKHNKSIENPYRVSLKKKWLWCKTNNTTTSFWKQRRQPNAHHRQLCLFWKRQHSHPQIASRNMEIWRYFCDQSFVTENPIKEIILDPYLETADIDRSNNHYPPKEEVLRFEASKQGQNRRGGEKPNAKSGKSTRN